MFNGWITNTLLARNEYPADMKLKLFQQLLHSYTNMQDKLNEPTILNLEQPQPNMLDKKLNEIKETLPKTIRVQGMRLLKSVNNTPDFNMGESGELIYKGESIRGSNVVDLIHDFTRKRKQRPVKGHREFAAILRDNNIPKEYIGNIHRWHLIDPYATGHEWTPY